MLSQFFAAVVERFRRLCRRNLVLSSHASQRYAPPPRLETLEDRCVLSSTTTIPAFSDIPAIVAIPDVLMNLQPKNDPTLVFVGDSINFAFEYGEGGPVWNAYWAPMGAVDYGVSGQTTQSLLYQFSLGQLEGIHPVEVILNIGGNNLLEGNSPQETANGVIADVAAIHQYLPDSKVLVLGVLPGKESPDDSYRIMGAQTDSLVKQMLAGDPRAQFVSINYAFLQPDGTISNTIMYDYLHPTTQGYMNMTNALMPIVQQSLGLAVPPQPATPTVLPNMPTMPNMPNFNISPTPTHTLPMSP